jgi:photosystem II stability/assembly factor-like uncharacterized protein
VLGTARCTRAALTYGYLGSIAAISSTTAFTIGDRGSLLVTHDAGRTWRYDGAVNDGAGGPAQVTFLSAKQGLVMLANSTTIWHTSNGGRTWTAVAVRT